MSTLVPFLDIPILECSDFWTIAVRIRQKDLTLASFNQIGPHSGPVLVTIVHQWVRLFSINIYITLQFTSFIRLKKRQRSFHFNLCV